jgi:uncharacterized membrane protein
MADPVADSKTPIMIGLGLVVLGIVIAATTGFKHGSIPGGLIAAAGAIPACFGMWKGIQQETQTTLALSVVTALVALGVGAILIVLRFVSWF